MSININKENKKEKDAILTIIRILRDKIEKNYDKIHYYCNNIISKNINYRLIHRYNINTLGIINMVNSYPCCKINDIEYFIISKYENTFLKYVNIYTTDDSVLLFDKSFKDKYNEITNLFLCYEYTQLSIDEYNMLEYYKIIQEYCEDFIKESEIFIKENNIIGKDDK